MQSDKRRSRFFERRSRFLVYPAFQYRLLARLVLYWVVYHLALWHVIFLVTFVCDALNAAGPGKGFWTMYGEFAAEHTGVILCFVGILPVFVCNMLRFSHRLAGPLVRFRNTMQAIADGKAIAPVKLRKHDLMSDFLVAFNRMVENWNSRICCEAPKELEETEVTC